ncbi:HipA domain-containing protein [Stappia sp.]|uniref:HipA domain-containing protein n=1 Tax=Stappia sp. TaxID=1870903 RepID=UPI003C79F148
MARRPTNPPLRVYLNSRPVGQLTRDPGGEIAFRYDDGWLALANAIPVSLSLPLREDTYRGAPVAAVFENLLPDADVVRRRVAERVGARGTDAYSLLAKIGHDCVGAMQFIAGDDDRPDDDQISGEVVCDLEIEKILQNLVQAPLGLARDDDFRISVAGVQEKTALLRHDGAWLKPHGTTPTTHILKTQIGVLPNGIDLQNSVETEFYCLKLAQAFGLPVAVAEISTFGETKALVVERFDRRLARDGRLLRLPQEDCCQALSIPPTQKYQDQGGPGIVQVLDLLKASDTPLEDQETFLAAQLLFWVIGATDGHAKNFSLSLRPAGAFRLTPLYDIVSVQPSLDRHEITRRQMRLAMSVGDNRHSRVDQIHPRHFLQTVARAGVADQLMLKVLDRIAGRADRAFQLLEAELPADFPEWIHASIKEAALTRIQTIERHLARA